MAWPLQSADNSDHHGTLKYVTQRRVFARLGIEIFRARMSAGIVRLVL